LSQCPSVFLSKAPHVVSALHASIHSYTDPDSSNVEYELLAPSDLLHVPACSSKSPCPFANEVLIKSRALEQDYRFAFSVSSNEIYARKSVAAYAAYSWMVVFS
jgi:hypothetical protein